MTKQGNYLVRIHKTEFFSEEDADIIIEIGENYIRFDIEDYIEYEKYVDIPVIDWSKDHAIDFAQEISKKIKSCKVELLKAKFVHIKYF